MKTRLIFFSTLTSLITINLSPQNQESLKDILWSRAMPCYTSILDYDGNGTLDRTVNHTVIDDSENGYLMVTGSPPPGGCGCTVTVGAYRQADGRYIILEVEEEDASWQKKISSNKDIESIMPVGFSLEDFIPAIKTENIDLTYPVFYLNVEIPRIGTDTKVTLELIPFGIMMHGDNLLSYEYVQDRDRADIKHLLTIQKISQEIKDDNTLGLIMEGQLFKISAPDRQIVENAIGDGDFLFKTFNEIQFYLNQLNTIYKLFSLIEYQSLIFSWDRNAGRFYIKQKIKKTESIVTFKEFLEKNKFWTWVC
jgi:hypothetical protein